MSISARALGSRSHAATAPGPGPAVYVSAAAAPLARFSPATHAAQRTAAVNGTTGHAPVYAQAPLRALTKAHIGE